MEEIRDIEVQIYPNPADERINLRINDGISARIFDFAGQIVKSRAIESPETLMDVSDLHTGVYLIEVITNRGSGVYKLIIE